ncbi:MAG: HAMP domain-containing sensor histidine kinase [Candidatus Gracilibacteria bacterium]|nr:HAMP domain-containing sensor histidine kinase [Candidatus Gracilibacteria bacterium]
MSNKTILNLEKKKKHLAVIFSVIVFLILFLLQIFFFTFKYVEYHSEISKKLDNDFKMITTMRNILGTLSPNCIDGDGDCETENFSKGNLGLNRGQLKDGKGPRFKPSDFILYNSKTSSIIFSNNSEDDFNTELVNNKGEYGIYENDLWDKDYFILRKNIKDNIDIFIYTEGTMDLSSIIFDLFKFFILSIVFSGLIYYLMIRFINRLFKPVEGNIEEMEDFVHNVGHELKTPLANMKSSLELAKLKGDYSDCAIDNFSEIDKMNNLIESLLTLSTLDTKKTAKFQIFPLIEDEIKNYSAKLNDKNISVNLVKNYDLKLNINSDHFRILFSNLLSNAIKYNIENGKIDIILDEKSLSIKDSGIGIENENFERIFEKFFREEFARGENGFGIGLSLVKKIISLYNWKIEVKSKKGEGTEFVIKF